MGLLSRHCWDAKAWVACLQLLMEDEELGEASHDVDSAQAIVTLDVIDGELAHDAAAILGADNLQLHQAIIAHVVANLHLGHLRRDDVRHLHRLAFRRVRPYNHILRFFPGKLGDGVGAWLLWVDLIVEWLLGLVLRCVSPLLACVGGRIVIVVVVLLVLVAVVVAKGVRLSLVLIVVVVLVVTLIIIVVLLVLVWLHN